MGIHFLFIGNVTAHLVALMSGIASFLIAIYETAKRRSITARWFWAIGLLCVFFAADQAWQDEHRNTETVKNEKSAAVAAANTCAQNRLIADTYTRGLEELNREQRERIDHQQTTNDAQQHDVSSCVISLGKMNPKVRQEIRVVLIPIGTVAAGTNKFTTRFGPGREYLNEAVVTTNEDQVRPSGYLRCIENFAIEGLPQLPVVNSTRIVGTNPPRKISDHEYQISVSDSGSYWGPSTPIYMALRSETETLNGCMFTPQ
jgi:hypothetical protein